MYNMDINELINTLEESRKGLAYSMWKQSYLITLGISDLLSTKGSKPLFPKTPEEASPELYPPKRTIEKPDFLKNKEFKKKGDMIIYE